MNRWDSKQTTKIGIWHPGRSMDFGEDRNFVYGPTEINSFKIFNDSPCVGAGNIMIYKTDMVPEPKEGDSQPTKKKKKKVNKWM